MATHTQDPSAKAARGADALDDMSRRKHNSNQTVTRTCQCGSIVVVPKGHAALSDDTDESVRCHACDAPLGKKLYDAFAR